MPNELTPVTRKWHQVNKWLHVAKTADGYWAATWYVKRPNPPAKQYLTNDHVDTRTGEAIDEDAAGRLKATHGWVVGIFRMIPDWTERKAWERAYLPDAQLYAWSTTVLRNAVAILQALGKEAVPSEELPWFECYKKRVAKEAKKQLHTKADDDFSQLLHSYPPDKPIPPETLMNALRDRIGQNADQTKPVRTTRRKNDQAQRGSLSSLRYWRSLPARSRRVM